MNQDTWAVVSPANIVENVILWDGVTPWSAPEGYLCVYTGETGAGPGWTYVEGVFIPPPVIIEEEVINNDIQPINPL